MLHKFGFRPILVLLLCLSTPLLVFAGTTGKIAGVVKDAENEEPLPGANVIIEGTTMGAASTTDGAYFIINIPPGTYRVKATMMGYEAVTQSDVVVRIDRTTTVDFSLKPTVIEGAEVTVVAEREVVRMDVSYTQTNMSIEAIEAVPATFRLNDVLETQAGIDQDRFGLTIRGSDAREIGYFVDGVSMRNERMDQGFDLVSKTAVQEVQLLTGAFNAEYGNARAGIVNVVNKNPKDKYFFNVETRYSPLWGGDDSDYPGLKHFGPYIFSDDNWWEYGRYDWNDGQPAPDKDGDGKADFEGWNSWAANNTFHGETLTPRQAYEVMRWQHRSEDQDGNVLYNGIKFGTVDQLYSSPPTHEKPFNWYGYRGDWVGDLTFGGPVPFTGGKVGFVLSHLRENSMYPFFTPGGGVYAYNTTQAKLIYSINQDMRLTFNGLYNDQTSFEQGDPEPRSRLEGARPVGAGHIWRDNNNVYRLDGNAVPKDIWTTILNLTWTHTLSPSTFYEVKLTNGNFKYRQVGNFRIRNLGDVYQVGPVWLDESPKGWAYKHGDNNDILGQFGLRGDRNTDLSLTKTFNVSADITSQITEHHQLKGGFEFTYKDIHEMTGYTQNLQYYTSEEYRLGPDGKKGTEDDGSTGDQANWHNVHVFPWSGGAYVQDRMEYGGMILNLGLRLDFHKSNKDWFDRNDLFYPRDASYWDTHYQRYGDNPDESGYTNYYGLDINTHPPIQVRLSPRFGIAHPVGAESKIFFNYGHFYDTPTNDHLYRFQLGVDEPVEEMGNPWLQLIKTIQFEAGWEQRIYGDYIANISGYYKDISNDLESGMEVNAREGGDYDYSINARGRDIKGFELRLEKKYGTYLTGFVNVEYRTEILSRYGWEAIYHTEDQQYLDDPTLTDNLIIVDDRFANTRRPGRWLARLNIALHSPQDWGPGPEVAGAKLLGWWDLTLLHRFYQGRSIQWNPDGLEKLEGVYNVRAKDYHRTNLHLEKRFTLAGVSAGAFLEITNLFNVKNLNPYMEWRNERPRFSRLIARQDRGETTEKELAYYEVLDEEDKKFGDEVDDPNKMPQRLYYLWDAPRDYWFGLRLYF